MEEKPENPYEPPRARLSPSSRISVFNLRTLGWALLALNVFVLFFADVRDHSPHQWTWGFIGAFSLLLLLCYGIGVAILKLLNY
jgi:hypothetical protein